MNRPTVLARRSLLAAAGSVAVAAWAGAACHRGSFAPNQKVRAMSTPNRMPVTFLPHGGGPWPFVEMGLPRGEVDELSSYLRSVQKLPAVAPKALLVISAHWEARFPR